MCICKSGQAPKRVHGIQSGWGLVLNHSEHLLLYRCGERVMGLVWVIGMGKQIRKCCFLLFLHQESGAFD
jgi:hypothetical protein